MKPIHLHSIALFLLLTISSAYGLNGKELRFETFTPEDGLPGNLVYCINQDREGWIWLGTDQGLSRFDGYRFKNFLPSLKDSNSIRGLHIRVIYEDKKGNLWVGAEGEGLNLFNRELETFIQPYEDKIAALSSSKSVFDIKEDTKNNLWIATGKDILIIDSLGQVNKFWPKDPFNEDHFNDLTISKIAFDKSNRLWIGTKTILYIIDLKTKEAVYTDLLLNNHILNDIKDFLLDPDGKMWVSTDSNGLFIIDPVSMKITPIILKPETERSKAVRQVAEDNSGNFWICTRAGLYVYNKLKASSTYYSHDEREPYSLANNSISSVFRDRNGEMWLGTRQGLNLLVQSKQMFQNYGAHPTDLSNKYLNSKSVYALWVDNDENIWAGTEDGGINLLNSETRIYTYFEKNKNIPNSISENCIKAFLDDKRGNLWIGTFHGGIDVLSLKTRNFTHFKNNPSDPYSLISNDVWDFALDKNGKIWIATSAGVDQYDPVEGRFNHFPNLSERERINWIETDSKNNIWFGSNNQIVIYNPYNGQLTRHKEQSFSFLEDSEGQCWITTFNAGLALYSIEKGPIRYFNQQDGLPSNHTFCVLEDHDRNLWISTSNGLTRFDPKTEIFLNFHKKDGIQNNVFCYGAAYKTIKGELLFGNISGFIKFNPAEIKLNSNPAPIVLTELRVLNRRVDIGSDEKAILKKSISVTQQIELNYTQNAFSLEFAALNYTSESNFYSYFLEGVDNEWSEPSNNRTATYNNLNPGEYVLHICRVVNSKRLKDNQLDVSIVIRPPFWKTLWFRILMIVFLFLFINFIILFFIYRERTKMELVLERVKVNKNNELNNLKLKFFTNISHEIRTPLTLILTPLEKLRSKNIRPEEIDSYLDIIYRNTRNLNELINQLLDFRKLETGNLKLELSSGDLVHTLSEIVDSYQGYAAEKGIHLRFNAFQKSLIAFYDAGVVSKILNNLLSNALKFTKPEGKIIVGLSMVFDPDQENEPEQQSDRAMVEISVSDTGIGIHEKNHEKIFDRFFQLEENEGHTGSGIGLSFAKELVKLHNGNIFVESKPGKGSKFVFRFPFQSGNEETNRDDTALNKETDFQSEDEANIRSVKNHIMLLVEDNKDVRLIIRDHFKDHFEVHEANNGQEGWALTLKFVPDVIISDVLMPDMDGFEYCKKVKNDERTSHIPLLLLTALHSKEDVIRGLESGADDYITKPFDLTILQTKIENILSVRDSYKEKFSATMMLKPKNIMISSPDQKFLHKAIEVIERNIADPNLDLDKFMSEVGVSRMQLYRKLHALTDMTVKEFIRDIRLKRAAQLLEQDTMTVSEVAYAVGFKDVSHFGKCFRQEYGINATEYKRSKSKNDKEPNLE